MKLLRCTIFLFLTILFTSCWPHGDRTGDTLSGTPTKADSVLPHKFHPKEKTESPNSASIKSNTEDVPTTLKR